MCKYDENLIILFISLGSLIISIIALTYTIRVFWLKKGDKYRVAYSSCSSRRASDSYIKSVTIENLKDKPLIIFRIHLKFWNNTFLTIQEFEEKPHIIPALEAYQFNYDPVTYYSIGWNKVSINKLFNNKRAKSEFILETMETNGFVLNKFFKNYYTAIIHPMRLSMYWKTFGDNIKYVIDLDNGKNLIPLFNKDTGIEWKQIPNDVLTSKEKVEEYCLNLKKQNEMEFLNIKIIDWGNRIQEAFNLEELKASQVEVNETATFIEYYILGMIYTVIRNVKTKIRNSNIYKKYQLYKRKIFKNSKK